MALRLVAASTSASRSLETPMTDSPGNDGSGSMPKRAGMRVRERRAGLTGLLAHLVAGLPHAQDSSQLRARLEEGLRQLVAARVVEVRDGVAGTSSRRSAGACEWICFEVPSTGMGRRAVLEAAFDPACGLDEWDFQLLQASTYVTALVLELERARPRQAAAPLRRMRDGAAPLIGASPGMKVLRERIERVAGTDFTVLIEGESGSGKELVARQIHELSYRRRGPFVAINCAALVETLLEAELFGIEERTATGVRGRRGKFEHADGGTLFLDEVSDLSPAAQAKLLRAIQDLAVERVGGSGTHRVDARIVVATNRNLGELMAKGRFRSDLFYRLNGVEIRVPPLRERREDVQELARYFLERHRAVRRLRLSESAAEALVAYEWPGNVRELERVMERAVALAESDEITLDDLPPAVAGEFVEVLLPSLTRAETLRGWGSRYTRLVLERCGRNKRQACRLLGISYHTLQAYLRYRPPGREAMVEKSQPMAESAVAVESTRNGKEAINT